MNEILVEKNEEESALPFDYLIYLSGKEPSSGSIRVFRPRNREGTEFLPPVIRPNIDIRATMVEEAKQYVAAWQKAIEIAEAELERMKAEEALRNDR